MNILRFDENKIFIKEFFEKLFTSNNLETIHLYYTQDNDRKLLDKYNDNTTLFHTIFYENKESFKSTYIDIIKSIIKDKYLYEDYIVYQSYPALRVSIPGNISVGEMHTDSEYNHPEEEMNYWLPITNVNNINTVWYESEPQKGDFQPMLIKYGEMAEVYFNKCRHFGKINTTDKTRLSLDFRIIPGSKWNNIKNHNANSLFAKQPLTIGNYYDKLYIKDLKH